MGSILPHLKVATVQIPSHTTTQQPSCFYRRRRCCIGGPRVTSGGAWRKYVDFNALLILVFDKET